MKMYHFYMTFVLVFWLLVSEVIPLNLSEIFWLVQDFQI